MLTTIQPCLTAISYIAWVNVPTPASGSPCAGPQADELGLSPHAIEMAHPAQVDRELKADLSPMKFQHYAGALASCATWLPLATDSPVLMAE